MLTTEYRNKGCFPDLFSRLPDDVLLTDVLPALTASELAQIAVVSERCRRLSNSEALWGTLFERRWGNDQVALHTAAAKKAGGWRHLWAAKHQTDKEAHPWQKPCAFEMAAAVDGLSNRATPEHCICFLLDGSGSVHEEDFEFSREFIRSTAEAMHKTKPDTKIAVIQFSSDAKVEFGPARFDEAFEAAIKGMVRMNGGTNISTAVQRAGQVMKSDVSGDSSRCVVLITDGRVDTYQAKEARQMAERLADEQRNVSFYAFAVGRGVDKAELLNIISANESETAADRYLDLCVRDEAPW